MISSSFFFTSLAACLFLLLLLGTQNLEEPAISSILVVVFVLEAHDGWPELRRIIRLS